MTARRCLDCAGPCFGARCRPCEIVFRTTGHSATCPDCGETRLITHKVAFNIRRGLSTERCRLCAARLRSERSKAAAAMRLARGLKCCFICKEEKPLEEFNRATKHHDGLSSRCQSCDRITARAYYRAHKEESRLATIEWQKRNPEKRREIARNHAKRFRRAHPERARARKDRTDFNAILAEHGMVCHICSGEIQQGDLHFDHIVPLSRGGAHARDNIKPAHARCNLRKGAKLMEELAA